jgi:hypothetical protein
MPIWQLKIGYQVWTIVLAPNCPFSAFILVCSTLFKNFYLDSLTIFMAMGIETLKRCYIF